MEVKYIHERSVHNTRAAEVIVPEIIAHFHPKSVVDVGCGIGTWLKVFEENGVSHLLGIDGEYVDMSMLMIDKSNFKKYDLNKVIDVNKKFDVVLCLEVAEHLEKGSSNLLIKSLTAFGDIVIFSAAIPGQGGQNHLNEQYPEYWVELFAAFQYFPVNDLRSTFWTNENVEWWYRQNIIIFKRNAAVNERVQYSLKVHPELYKRKLNEIEGLNSKNLEISSGKISPQQAFKIFIKSVVNYLKAVIK